MEGGYQLMSQTVDERVVSMQFDNKNFESNVNQSMSSLDKLNKSLQMSGASSGLRSVASASGSTASSMSNLGSAVESVHPKFSALQIMGATVLANLTNSATNAAKRIVGSMTNALVSGGKQRALNIEQAKFQLKGLGVSWNKVSKDIDYAVKDTSYGMDVAAKAASQLSASGIKTGDEMKQSLRGISGVAAMTSSSYEDISNIFTRVAGQGRVMAVDLNSISARGINAAAELAKYLHTTEANVRDMTSKGKIDFQTFAAAMDGAFGEHAKEANKTFTGALANMNAALSRIGEEVFTPLHESLRKIILALTSVIDNVHEFLGPAFDYIAKGMERASKSVVYFLASLSVSKGTLENLKTVGKGFAAILDLIGKGLRIVWGVLGPVLGFLGKIILGFAAAFGQLFIDIDKSINKTGSFKKTINGLHGFVTKLKNALKDTSEAASGLKEGFKNVIEGIAESISNIKFSDILGGIGKGIKAAFQGILNFLSGINFQDIINVIFASGFTMLAVKFARFVSDILSSGTELRIFFSTLFGNTDGEGGLLQDIKGFNGKIFGIFNKLEQTFMAWQMSLNAKTLRQIGLAIALIVGSVFLLSTIPTEKLSRAIMGLTIIMIELVGAMKVLTGFMTDGGIFKALAMSAQLGAIGGLLTSLAVAILILSFAMKQLGKLNWEEIAKGLLGVAGLMGLLVGATFLLSKVEGKMAKGAMNLVIFAVAIKILASACKDLGKLSWGEIVRGLTGLAGILGVIVGTSALLSKIEGKVIQGAASVVIFAVAMKVMASAVKDLGELKVGELVKGLIGLAAIMAEIVAFSVLMSATQGVSMSTSLSLVVIAAALNIMADAIAKIGGLSIAEIGKGLLGISVALVAIAVATSLMPSNLIVIGIGLIAVGAALNIIADAITTLGAIGYENLKVGLIALGGSLVILAFGLTAMNGTLGGSAALLVASAALSILAPVIITLGKMKWVSIAKGLGIVAAGLAILGIAAVAIPKLALLGLAAALFLIGASVGLIGVGLAAAATGLAALLTAIASGGAAIVSTLDLIVKNLIETFPSLCKAIGEGIIVLFKTLGSSADALAKSATQIILAFIKALTECIPQMAEGLLKTILGVLDAAVQYGPQIIDRILTLVIQLINALAAKIPEIIVAVLNLLASFFEGLRQALGSMSSSDLLDAVKSIGILTAIFIACAALGSLAASAMVGVLAFGALIAELTLVLAAVGGLSRIPGLQDLIADGGNFLMTVGTAIGQFVGGIVGGIAEGVASTLPAIGTALSTFMTNLKPFLDGIAAVSPESMQAASYLAKTILLLTAADLIEGIASFLSGGTDFGEFGKKIAEFGTYLKQFADNTAGIDSESVLNSAKAASALASFAAKIPNSGGLIACVTGENDLAQFGQKIVSFGASLMVYSALVAGVDSEVVSNSAKAGEALANFASKIPNSGGLVSCITGDNDIAVFGVKMVIFGACLRSYASQVAGIDADAISKSTKAAKSLVSMASGIKKTGGLKSLFTGDNDLGGFGKQLNKFGKCLVEYGESIAGIDMNNFTKGTTAINSLVSSIKKANSTNTENIGKFVKAAKKIGELDVDTSNLESSAKNVKSSVNSMVKSMSSTIKSSKSNITSSMKTAVSGISSAVKSATSSTKSAATTLMNALASAIKGKKSSVTSAAKTAVSGAAGAIKEKRSEFSSAGSYLGSGLVSGMGAKGSDVYNAGYALGEEAAKGVKKGAKVNSPSKLTIPVGESMGEGLIVGMDKTYKPVAKAGEALGQMAGKSLTSAVSSISDAVGSGIDVDPTIRPILDLSDIEKGAGLMSNMLNTEPSVGVKSNLSAIGSSDLANQNGNNEIINTLKDLKTSIKDKIGDTYSINGITYDDGTNVASAVETLVHAAKIERRI